MKTPRAKNSWGILNKNKVAGLLDIKFYYKAKIIKIMWHWHDVRNIMEWSGMTLDFLKLHYRAVNK